MSVMPTSTRASSPARRHSASTSPWLRSYTSSIRCGWMRPSRTSFSSVSRRDLAADRVEAGQQHRLGGVVDDQVDAGHRLERADVAALAADDPALHLVAGQVQHADHATRRSARWRPAGWRRATILRARCSPSSRASLSMSRTMIAASRLAWFSIAVTSSALASSAVRPATRSSDQPALGLDVLQLGSQGCAAGRPARSGRARGPGPAGTRPRAAGLARRGAPRARPMRCSRRSRSSRRVWLSSARARRSSSSCPAGVERLPCSRSTSAWRRIDSASRSAARRNPERVSLRPCARIAAASAWARCRDSAISSNAAATSGAATARRGLRCGGTLRGRAITDAEGDQEGNQGHDRQDRSDGAGHRGLPFRRAPDQPRRMW